MGKRLIRIFQNQIAQQLPVLVGEELNVILKNGVTLHGRINRFDSSTLLLKDLLGRPHTIRLADVEEVVLDKVSFI
jgi:sRNA-binding regulator protein Hfq